jgi:beta-galactosidase
MYQSTKRLLVILNCLIAVVTVARGGTLTATVGVAPAPQPEYFHMGSSGAPNGSSITVDQESLRLDGHAWAPVMGEFHYTRYPAAEWREELLKMKGGGITIVSTYVFWIHHEEIEGKWDWSENRNLREFVRLAGTVGLKVIVRCGPWCHGEVRNGGLPEWLVKTDWPMRTTDPRFLGKVQILYGQIAAQLRGQLWKDGGPVIGIQLDNEFSGPAEYLLALKRIAREAGLDVPLYTRTGWSLVTTPMPFGEIVPLYGAYAEGFWSRELTSMPGTFWNAFRFSLLRFEDNIATEQRGGQDVHDAPDVAKYPYLTCEIGGGMMNSYHRRILINPYDVESTTLVKLGSGSTLPGYYMYHGGINPTASLTTLMEAQDTLTTNYNDLPVRNYDFQAPIGDFGQIRPQYHLLRRLHLFLADFGEGFAQMSATMPDARPGPHGDTSTLRWAVRSDGRTGYVFVNNYERSLEMPAKQSVQFSVTQPGGLVRFPASPVDIPADSLFFWPFNFDLGHGVRLAYATAEPVCAVDDEDGRTVFFAETLGVPSQFAVTGEAGIRTVTPGRGAAFQISGTDGKSVRVVLLSDSDSLALWKGSYQGRERVFLTRAGLVLDGGEAHLTSGERSDLSVGIYPAPPGLSGGTRDGVFMRYTPPMPPAVSYSPQLEEVRKAGPAREIPLGKISEPEAAEPIDADFASAAEWRITLPAGMDMASNPILRIHYVGDVARFTLDGKLLVDDFYNGRVFDLGLRRYGPQISGGGLMLSVLPLRKDALSGPKQRIFMADSARPDFGAGSDVASVLAAEIIPEYHVELNAGGAR